MKTNIPWKRALGNGADLCVNEGQKLRVSLAKEERRRKVDFDCVWFSRKTAVLESTSMFSGSISHVDNDGDA